MLEVFYFTPITLQTRILNFGLTCRNVSQYWFNTKRGACMNIRKTIFCKSAKICKWLLGLVYGG
jgi:hypothetical protein